jgi:hypothetical protein
MIEYGGHEHVTNVMQRKAICTRKNSPAECTNSERGAAAGHSTMQLSHMLMRYDNTMGDPQPSSRKVSKKIFLHAATVCNSFIFLLTHKHLSLSTCSVCVPTKDVLCSYARALFCSFLRVWLTRVGARARLVLSQSRRQVRFSNGTNLFILSLLAESLTNCCEGLRPGLKQHTAQPW